MINAGVNKEMENLEMGVERLHRLSRRLLMLVKWSSYQDIGEGGQTFWAGEALEEGNP
jgi:hypothetical protein